jgi:hypothetical protein
VEIFVAAAENEWDDGIGMFLHTCIFHSSESKCSLVLPVAEEGIEASTDYHSNR